ncbi:MAG: hypothetical protein ABFR82_01700 [Nitrospirota bacterium]
MTSTKSRFRSSTGVLIASLTIYAVLIISCCHYQRLTGDATLYLSIAEKYLRGDFANAINGYWGPLLSWLLVPFLYVGATHVYAINTMHLFLGLFTITGIWRLSYKFEMSETIRCIILAALVPVLLFVSLIEPMDFLLLCVLVYYFNVVFSRDYPKKVFHAVTCGILGGLAYYSKPYGFPFFISHFMLINVCHYFAQSSAGHRKNVIRNAAAGFVVFVLISGVWIALISNKYDHLTFSNQGRGVFASLGPGSEHNTLEKGDPIFFEGFFAPPNDTAFVIYEDPTYARKKTWNPLESRSLLKHYLGNLLQNIFEGIRIYESFSRLSVAIIIAYILLIFFQPVRTLFDRPDLLYPLLTVALYTGGYMPFHFEIRYLWPVNILLLLMGGRVLNELFKSVFFRSDLMKNILMTIFLLSFIATPLKTSIDMSRNNLNRSMHDLGEELDRRYDLDGNIASNVQKEQHTVYDSWHRTFRLSYWLKGRYFGQPRENISDRELEREFEKYNIDYYFFWGDSTDTPEVLSRYKEITNRDIPGLFIYSIKERKK